VAEPIQIGDSVLDAWDLAQATLDARPGNLFPSQVAWNAVAGNERVADVLAAVASAGYRPDRPETVRVPKFDRTTRPGADLAMEDQVIYAALVDAIRERIHEGYVTFTGSGEHEQSYEDFERYPLTEADARYVLEADASAFYQYIDHEILAYELIGLTGWAEATEAISRLLQGWTGTSKGLPQGPWPSYVLADVYISTVARSLLRAGFRFRRYSDDFRIVASTWTEVREAQLRLEEAFHAIGLVIAPRKLKTPKIDTYRGYLERADDPRLRSVASREAFAELEAGEYEPPSPAPKAVTAHETQRAEEVVQEQLETLPITVLSTRLIRRALPKLGRGRSTVGLRLLPRLLARYPHLTPNLASYLRLLMGTNLEDRAVRAVLTWLQGPSYRFPWQVGWLLSALTRAESQHADAADFAASVVYRDDVPWFARGQAALVIAIHGSLPTPTEFVSVFERSPRATRADLVAAVVIGQPRWRRLFLDGVAADPVLGPVADLDPDEYRTWL
jgi:RNA-directed DNA polymerase